jgi:hypothetical protein
MLSTAKHLSFQLPTKRDSSAEFILSTVKGPQNGIATHSLEREGSYTGLDPGVRVFAIECPRLGPLSEGEEA